MGSSMLRGRCFGRLPALAVDGCWPAAAYAEADPVGVSLTMVCSSPWRKDMRTYIDYALPVHVQLHVYMFRCARMHMCFACGHTCICCVCSACVLHVLYVLHVLHRLQLMSYVLYVPDVLYAVFVLFVCCMCYDSSLHQPACEQILKHEHICWIRAQSCMHGCACLHACICTSVCTYM